MSDGKDVILGTHLGIPHFSWDVIARVIPGMVALAILWGMVIPFDEAKKIGNALHQPFPWWWLVAIGIAYVAGQLADCLSWRITTKRFALRHTRKEAMKNRRFKAWLCERLPSSKIEAQPPKKAEREEQWRELFRTYSLNREKSTESVWIEKSQIESRSMANLSMLVLVTTATATVVWLRKCESLARFKWGGDEWILLVSLGVVAVLSLFASSARQRRRVVGMVNVVLGEGLLANSPNL